MSNRMFLNADIVRSGVYDKKVVEKAMCINYIEGSLGELYDFYGGSNYVNPEDINIVGYVEISKKDYMSHVYDLCKGSNVYMVCEYLLNYSSCSDNDYVRVTDGIDSFLVKARKGKIDKLAIVKTNQFKFITKLKNIFGL